MTDSTASYVYIDQNAWGHQDDSPLGCAQGVRLRDNLQALHEWRFPQSTCAFPTVSPDETEQGGGRRICSVYPVAWGPFWLYLPESLPEIELSLRLDSVVWSFGSTPPAPGTDAIWFHATTMTPTNHELPPEHRDEWSSGAVVTTGTAQTIKLTARNPGGQTGWVGALLWSWSEIDSTPEGTYTINGRASWGALAVTNTAGTAYDASTDGRVPERAIGIFPATSQNTVTGQAAGGYRQVCHWAYDVDVAEDVLYPAPPFADNIDNTYYKTHAQLKSYTMGVAVVAGIAVQAAPSLTGPARELFYSLEPARDISTQALVSETNRLVAQRMPHWCGQSVNHARHWWDLLELSTSYSDGKMVAFVAANPPPANDRAGFRYLVGLFSGAAGPYAEQGLDGKIDIKLSIEAVAGAEQENIELTDQTIAIAQEWGMGPAWEPLPHNVWGSREFEQSSPDKVNWQFIGALLGNHPSTPHVTWDTSDLRRITWVELVIQESSITYPATVKVSAKTPSADYLFNVTVISGACVSLALDQAG